jgi:hypothetical protein
MPTAGRSTGKPSKPFSFNRPVPTALDRRGVYGETRPVPTLRRPVESLSRPQPTRNKPTPVTGRKTGRGR